MKELFVFFSDHHCHSAGFRGPQRRNPDLPDATALVVNNMAYSATEQDLERVRGCRYDRVTTIADDRLSDRFSQAIRAYHLHAGGVLLEL